MKNFQRVPETIVKRKVFDCIVGKLYLLVEPLAMKRMESEMERVFALFSILLMICVPNAFFINSRTSKASESAIVRVVPEQMTVKLGQPFSVNITFENLPYSADNGVTGCEFNLTWNNSVLQGMSMKEIAFHTATPQTEWWNIWNIRHVVSNGSVLYACTWQDGGRAISQGYAPLKGNGTWASITFVSILSDETDLNLTGLVIGSTSELIQAIGVDGKVSVAKMLAGDINQDGAVDSTDAAMLSTAFGAVLNDSHWNSGADINSDNSVNICDAIILARNFGKHYP